MAHYTGAIFGPYEVLDLIARGGMGEVYRARHRRLQGREAAIKIMPAALAADPSFLQRFEREANNVAALNHPHILPIWDYGDQDGAPYIVMPLVTGGSLRDQFHGRALPVATLLGLLTPLASALDYAHQRGIIHRDIKPANVLLDTSGHLFLADFGIAKGIGPGVESLTQAGVGIGTPEYMAPEQTDGRADPRSDVYALGVIAYEGLTGHVPYSGNTPVDVAIKHITTPLPPMTGPNGPIAPAVEEVVRRALAKAPDERYATAGAFVADLAEVLRRTEAGRTTTALVAAPPDPAGPTSTLTRSTAVLRPGADRAAPPEAATGVIPRARPAAARGRRFLVAALVAVVLLIGLAAGALALFANRSTVQTGGTLGGGATVTAIVAASAGPANDIPYPFPVTNARIISDYARAQKLLPRDAADGRLHELSIDCFDPRANADCRLDFTLYSQQKDMLYEYTFSYYETAPPQSDMREASDVTDRTVFMQLPWERNPDWATLLRESANQLPANIAPNGFSVSLGVQAPEFNRGDIDWYAQYTDKDSGGSIYFKQRGKIVTKVE